MIKVKICGITNLQDAQIAAQARADFLGFIFHPTSPRNVSPDQVRRIVAQLRPEVPISNPQPPLPAPHMVGVFVDRSLDAVWHTASHCGLDYVQLHGAESPEMVAALRARGLSVIKSFRVRKEAPVEEMKHYQALAFLLDTHVPGKAGGTGRSFDWKLAAQAASVGPILLAGGLRPDNVAQAIGIAQPWGVDVSSGVEAQPGRKDPNKVQTFISAAKSAT